ncbi:glycosyltransferase family 2 protein [Umezawaea sp. Da 62-37]|uniref:glycosyltransferase family 2 protein n=1 Tax=Umezawaea sp. Da 62-37 TaxID=3075927 RepID=UPI0028F704CB|nr:glycosyltransferase family 2 protein [Umezawaea sp. Da 62-37]WNV85110.1 glycosyltransferase family 2 protein [Umezawaea sp. Da 62-37]
MVKLSIIMPAYNESATIVHAIAQVLRVDYPCPVELIVVNDGSSDGTAELLEAYGDRDVLVVNHPRNLGKGAAVRTGVARSTGTHMIIFDADLEYAPSDIPAMLQHVLDGRADHVFGARVFGFNTRYPSFRFATGGRLLTLAANLLFDSCLTDMHTCLKLVPIGDFEALRLTESGFGLDTELTARLIRGGVRPYEVPISYNGRSFQEGKKISWSDGLRCLAILTKVRAERVPQALPARPAVRVPFPAEYLLPVPATATNRDSRRASGLHAEIPVRPVGEADSNDAAVAM